MICANHVKGPLTEANWYIVYLAAVAVDAMCVRQGLAGIAWDIGLCRSRCILVGEDSSLHVDSQLVTAAFL